MQCSDCGTVWYSRVADIIVRNPELARCARCQGQLRLADPADAQLRETVAAREHIDSTHQPARAAAVPV